MKKYLFPILILISGCITPPELPVQPQNLKVLPYMTAIDVLGPDMWTDPEGLTHQGGLYPDGYNFPPVAHQNKIEKATAKLNGPVGLMTIGASNCMYESMEFSAFINADNVQFVNAAMGGKTLEKMLETAYWNYVHNKVTEAGLTTSDIQVIIFESNSFSNAIAGMTFVEWRDYVTGLMVQISQRVLQEFPQVVLMYMPGTTYSDYYLTGYSKFAEPWSYYLSWSIKELIQKQITGDPSLKASGPGKTAPVLAWMYPHWSDGVIENSYGFNWLFEDVNPVYPGAIDNGVHPSIEGAQKVAAYWNLFFTTNENTATWY